LQIPLQIGPSLVPQRPAVDTCGNGDRCERSTGPIFNAAVVLRGQGLGRLIADDEINALAAATHDHQITGMTRRSAARTPCATGAQLDCLAR